MTPPERPDGPDQTAWNGYVESFHAHAPGITETVLAPCRADGATPYEWLAESVDPSASTVLDLACGSAPLAQVIGTGRIIGIDRSEAELAVARAHHPAPLVRGDAARLPFPARSVDTVTCSFALMVATPLDEIADEIARVTRRGGGLSVLLPARGPLSMRDRIRYASLAVRLGSRPARFPNPTAGHDLVRVLAERGYRVDHDESVRFAYPIVDEAAADAFVASCYLPDIPDRRRDAGRQSARRWIGSDLGLPLRRVSATAGR